MFDGTLVKLIKFPAEHLTIFHGTLVFRGTPVENHWPKVRDGLTSAISSEMQHMIFSKLHVFGCKALKISFRPFWPFSNLCNSLDFLNSQHLFSAEYNTPLYYQSRWNTLQAKIWTYKWLFYNIFSFFSRLIYHYRNQTWQTFEEFFVVFYPLQFSLVLRLSPNPLFLVG